MSAAGVDPVVHAGIANRDDVSAAAVRVGYRSMAGQTRRVIPILERAEPPVVSDDAGICRARGIDRYDGGLIVAELQSTLRASLRYEPAQRARRRADRQSIDGFAAEQASEPVIERYIFDHAMRGACNDLSIVERIGRGRIQIAYAQSQ